MSQLFQEGTIGQMKLRNRLVKSATFESMSGPGGECTGQLQDMHRRIAAGGTGLTVVAYLVVHPTGVAWPKQSRLDRDDLIAGFQELANQVHGEGGCVAAQLNHSGRAANPELIGQQPWGPSPIPDRLLRTKPRAMTEQEIEEVLAAYGLAAARAKEAGFDAIQLHCAHGYLISQFLSPATNQRDDGWGGSLANRQRFGLEAVRRVRAAVGPDYPLLIKLNTDDYIKNGISLDEAQDTAQKMAEAGVDAIELSGGFTESVFYISRGGVPIDVLVRGMSLPKRLGLSTLLKAMEGKVRLEEEAYFRPAVQQIKPHLDVPVIMVGGMRSQSVMEDVLAAGDADFISMARPLIREPNLPTRFQKGTREKATCESCNRCLAEMALGNPLRCYYRD